MLMDVFKMKRIYLGLFIVFGLIGLAGAITLGNILTQNQLNNQDVMNTDLEESFLRDGSNKVVHDRSGTEEIFYVNILSIDKVLFYNETLDESIFTGNYIIVEKTFEISVDIKRWKERKDKVGIDQAKSELKEWLKAQKNRIEQTEKRRIIELQTNTNNLDDFELDDLEI